MEISVTQQMDKEKSVSFFFTCCKSFFSLLFMMISFHFPRNIPRGTNMGFLRAEFSGWLEARPGPVPIRRFGVESPPFAARGWGLAGRGLDEGSRWGGWEEGGPGSSRRCLKDKKQYLSSYSFHSILNFCLNMYIYVAPPVSSVPGGGDQDAGGALVGPSL